MAIDFEKDLNSEQFEAATSDARHLRIVAGAGTGKTRTLTYRLAYLITRPDVRPEEIVAITFTNKAAAEMRERTIKLLHDADINVKGMPTICTFHSFCYRFLRHQLAKHFIGFNNSFAIADEQDSDGVYKKALERITAGKEKANPKMLKDAKEIIGRFKTEGKEPEDISADSPDDMRLGFSIKKLYEAYQQILAENNLVDFDDLLIYTRDILERDEDCRDYYQHLYRIFMVDEFQDTNELQYQLVKLFMSPSSELSVVGDPDQTIYTWRGADNRIIRSELEKDFPDLVTVTLDLNYRSTQSILDKANMLIRHNTNRVDKSLKAASGQKGDEVEFVNSYDAKEDAQTLATRVQAFHTVKNVPYNDMAVIVRSNYQSRIFEQVFTRSRVPYRLYDAVSFYERQEVKAGLAYMRILINTADNISLEKVLQYPSRGIGDKTLARLYQAADEAKLPLMEYILKNADKLPVSETIKISLNTLVANYNRVITSLQNSHTPAQMAEAMRVYFENTGLFNCIRKMDKDDSNKKGQENENDRENNLKELLTDFKDYIGSALSGEDDPENTPDLNGFLINVALISSQDDKGEEKAADKVNIMTAHVSKGLEFPVVFVDGMVEGVFPTSHAINEGRKEAIEEERRLFYVAMTRARKYLYITTYGGMRFNSEFNEPSSFLKEIGFKERAEDKGFLNSQRNNHQSYASPYRKRNSAFSSRGRYNRDLGFQPDEMDKDYGFPTQFIKPQKIVTYKAPAAPSADDVEYKVGDKVAHSSFGVGTVTAVNGRKLTVQFAPEIGTKILIAGFKAFRKIV